MPFRLTTLSKSETGNNSWANYAGTPPLPGNRFQPSQQCIVTPTQILLPLPQPPSSLQHHSTLILYIANLIPACAASLSPHPIPLLISVAVNTNAATLWVAPIATNQPRYLCALSHRQSRTYFTSHDVHLEAGAIVPSLPWRRVNTGKWKKE